MPRRGFSIVEVIVAMMIVTVGLLGMAGGVSLALRTTLDTVRRRDAAERVLSRVATLAAAGCAGAVSGSASDGARHLTERWAVRNMGAFAQVSDTVTWLGARGTATFALTSAIPC